MKWLGFGVRLFEDLNGLNRFFEGPKEKSKVNNGLWLRGSAYLKILNGLNRFLKGLKIMACPLFFEGGLGGK